MNRRIFFLAVTCLCCLILISSATTGSARGTFTLGWWVIGGAGGASAGGDAALHSTLGQPVVASASSDSFSMEAGYASGVTIGYEIYLPLALRST